MRDSNLEVPDTRTYKDFKIGQTVICSGPTCGNDENYIDPGWWLTIGKEYVIDDLDFHFPNKICVKPDNGNSGFFFIRLFDSKQSIREQKLVGLLDE